MKAMVVKRPKERLILEERERPTLGPGQALIKVHACGVCHSDLHALLGDFPFAKFPLVLGHEVAGVVEAFGEGVNWPKVGTRVGMPWLYSACGHCPACLKGDEVLCPEMQVTGVTVDGGYAEYMQAPAAYLTPIPDELTFEEAAPLMCAGLTVYNALVNAGFKPGQKVAVIGTGRAWPYGRGLRQGDGGPCGGGILFERKGGPGQDAWSRALHRYGPRWG